MTIKHTTNNWAMLDKIPITIYLFLYYISNLFDTNISNTKNETSNLHTTDFCNIILQ